MFVYSIIIVKFSVYKTKLLILNIVHLQWNLLSDFPIFVDSSIIVLAESFRF